MVHVAGGTWEYFENPGDDPARVLIVWTDPDIEAFFEEAAERAPRHELPPPAGPPSPEAFEHMAQIGRKYGLELRAPT